jgi:hypothetical protein
VLYLTVGIYTWNQYNAKIPMNVKYGCTVGRMFDADANYTTSRHDARVQYVIRQLAKAGAP